MIITSKGKRGRLFTVASGVLGKDAKYVGIGEKKTSKTFFGLKVDEYKDENGEKKAQWVNCECWYKLARYAAALEKGDAVLVAGTLERDDYWSERNNKEEYKLVCDFIQVQSYGDTAESAGAPQSDERGLDVAPPAGINACVREIPDELPIDTGDDDVPF